MKMRRLFENCVFCNRDNIMTDIIYEDELVMAFKDYEPINEGHVLLIPKEHFLDVDEMPDELLAHLMLVSKKIVADLKEVYHPAGYSIMQNGGAFNDVGHYHLHIFPRYEGDGFGWTSGSESQSLFDCGMEKDNYWFRYRTGAIIIRDGKMLFVKSEIGGYYYMIGGGVHLGEDSKTCIERETLEETGVNCTAKRIAIVSENFFNGVGGEIDGKECHVLECYYLMDVPDNASFETETDAAEELVWIPIDEFSKHDIRPAFLKQELQGVIEGGPLIHILNDERK